VLIQIAYADADSKRFASKSRSFEGNLRTDKKTKMGCNGDCHSSLIIGNYPSSLPITILHKFRFPVTRLVLSTEINLEPNPFRKSLDLAHVNHPCRHYSSDRHAVPYHPASSTSICSHPPVSSLPICLSM